jgi:hypothetical protein
MRIDKRRFYHLDWYLILNGLLIFGIGMMNLISATSSFSSGSWNFIIKQLIAFVLGLGLMLVVMYYDYRMIASHSKWPRGRRRQEMDQYFRVQHPAFGTHETDPRHIPGKYAL